MILSDNDAQWSTAGGPPQWSAGGEVGEPILGLVAGKRRCYADSMLCRRWLLSLLLLVTLTAAACGDDGDAATGSADAGVGSVDAGPSDPGAADPGETSAEDPGDGEDAAAPVDGGGEDEGAQPRERLTSLVNTFVGTGSTGFNFGALFPGATMPFGMVKLSPDTGPEKGKGFPALHAGGYFYTDPKILGFSHIHLAGTGVGDYGTLLVVPRVGDPAGFPTSDEYRIDLRHEGEHAEPGYYRLESLDPPVKVELTATERAGFHRYTFDPEAVPEGEKALLVVDLTHALGNGRVPEADAKIDPESGEITGSVHVVGDFTVRFQGYDFYFVIKPSRAPDATGTYDSEGFHAGAAEVEGDPSRLYLSYDVAEDPVVELKVGISFVDLEGARKNLEAEAEGVGFDEVREAASAAWEEALSIVEVEGGTDTRRRLLYTMLYRTQMMPTLFTDVDRRYRGIDKEVHEAKDFTYYTDFSLWDTYRTTHPLFVLLMRDRQADFLLSLTRMAKEGGSLPKWALATGYTGSMVGSSADVVIGDSVVNGMTDFDVEAVYEVMRAVATGPSPGNGPSRDGVATCIEHEYCPDDEVGGSVSKTLEYAHNDYCIAKVAQHLGRDADAEMFFERAGWWKNLFDEEKGFLAPRNADGSLADYDPRNMSDSYTEGTPWHYLFMVPHDVPGLVQILGGAEPFVEKLETFMSKGKETWDPSLPNRWYYQGNEPDILAPFLFGFGGRPELSSHWAAWAADNTYSLEPWGLAGNDDGGTLAAWYVFAAAGLYPLTCTGGYTLSAPLFDKVVWHLEGADLEIRLAPADQAAPTVDGEEWTEPTVPHSAIAGGALLTIPAGPGGP